MRTFWHECKKPLFLILISVAAFFLFYRIDRLLHFLQTAISLLMPFIIGGSLAFILDIPMRQFERLFARHCKKLPSSAARTISFLLVLVLIAAFFTGTWFLVIPDLNNAYSILRDNLPGMYEKMITWLKGLDLTWLEEIFAQNEPMTAETIKSHFSSALQIILQGLYISGGAISTFTSSAWNIFLTLLATIYLLFDKTRLLNQFRRLAFALFRKKHASRLISLASLTCETFEDFILGQLKMAPIFGALVVLFMLIAKMPYALLVGFLSALFSLVPLVGATLSLILGAALLLLQNPMQALWFTIGYLVLQQIEGNIIYPHVVGHSVGLSPIWILLAVSLGGSLMGVAGMILFVPLFAVLYSCLKKYVLHREARIES